MATSYIPKQYHAVTPELTIRGAADAIDFYKKAFGAVEIERFLGPSGKIMHAEIKIGDSIVMLSDEFPEMGNKSPESLGGCTGGLLIYVDRVDDVYNRAVKAGATSLYPPQDMFWGDRFGTLKDPFGHRWSIATHVKDLTKEEILKGQKEFLERMPVGAGAN